MTDARKNNRPPPLPRKLTDESVCAIARCMPLRTNSNAHGPDWTERDVEHLK